MARPGNQNTATARHHLDTIRLSVVDLRAMRDQIVRRARRQATRLHADLADYREVRLQVAGLDALIEEMDQALRGFDQKAAAA